MESNEMDRLIDDNQSGQNMQQEWRTNSDREQGTRSIPSDDGNEVAEDDVRPEQRQNYQVPESDQWSDTSDRDQEARSLSGDNRDDESEEEIPHRTDTNREGPYRDLHHDFEPPVSDEEDM
jgi:hypothetical protein